MEAVFILNRKILSGNNISLHIFILGFLIADLLIMVKKRQNRKSMMRTELISRTPKPVLKISKRGSIYFVIIQLMNN